jgi:molecular chaperone GrpE
MRSDIPEEREAETGQGDFDATVEADAVADQPDGTGEVAADAREADAAAGEMQELKDRYLRLAAEYDNFRKRTDRERMESRDRAQAQLLEKLLEPLDDLQRVAHLDAETTRVDAVLEGVRLVERKLLRSLEAAGLEPLDARGQRFDPTEHDALMITGTEDEAEDDTVGEVFQPGYRFRGLLLRPARVQVRKHGG